MNKIWNKGLKIGRKCVNKNLRPVKVIDILTNEETYYETYRDFAISINASVSTMANFLKNGYKTTNLYNKRYIIMKI